MAQVRDVVAAVEGDESPALLAREGIDLFRGWARFTGVRTVDVDGTSLLARRVVLATGADAAVPPVDGLIDVGYLDNRSVFSLPERPEHLLVLGGAAIGVELAQAFAGLGSRVTLAEGGPRLLAEEEPEVSGVSTDIFRREGVEVRVGSEVTSATRTLAGPELTPADGSIAAARLFGTYGRATWRPARPARPDAG